MGLFLRKWYKLNESFFFSEQTLHIRHHEGIFEDFFQWLKILWHFKVILSDVIVNHLLSVNPAGSGFIYLFYFISSFFFLRSSICFFRYNISRWMRPIYTPPLALCPIAFLCPRCARRVSFFVSFWFLALPPPPPSVVCIRWIFAFSQSLDFPELPTIGRRNT